MSKIEVLFEQPIMIRHQISIINGQKQFSLENEFKLVKGGISNKEFLLRFFTEVQNENVFYTDLNGMQVSVNKLLK